MIESGILNTDDEVLINYCDFANIWDWKKFKDFIKNKPDGVVPAYFGLHPHSIYDNDYAFIQNDGDKILKIREKSIMDLLIIKLMNMLLREPIIILKKWPNSY